MMKTILHALGMQIPMMIIIYGFYRGLLYLNKKKQTKNIKTRILLLKILMLFSLIYTFWNFITDIF